MTVKCEHVDNFSGKGWETINRCTATHATDTEVFRNEGGRVVLVKTDGTKADPGGDTDIHGYRKHKHTNTHTHTQRRKARG
mgnify:FL=1